MFLIKHAVKPLAKSVLMPLRLTAAALAINVAIQKKVFQSTMTALIMSNKELDDIMKIIKFLEESGYW